LLHSASTTDCPNRADPACQAGSTDTVHVERQFGASSCRDDDRPLVRTEDSMENDSVADSEETDPEASKMLEVPDPVTSRVVAPELIGPERRAQHRRGVLDGLERWIP
jgi:DNA replication initiation complex subunit (GINS family)